MEEHPLMRFTQEEVERAQRRSRRKFQTDRQSDLATAEDNGKAIRSVEIARKMLSAGETVEKISLFTDLTQQEIEQLR